ncbi:hypothetical protein J1N35_004252 [Gossypium stocksii]|uniref:F-box/LRR-repeat protein 15/At3g58940/PEG3-like LRR domain-containing protein n=1 Tax=Gossypium stocksii TaxID=47602 RepID=A0A9D3WBM3_9ROSI|nr:hypothetical protein J1N35_004252 [Gossypium stocksii]
MINGLVIVDKDNDVKRVGGGKLSVKGGNKTLIGLATFRVSVIFPRTASSSSGFLTATQVKMDDVEYVFAVGYLLHFGMGLTISLDEFTTLPGVLFTCSTLITLKLDIGFLLDVPKGVIFPNLNTLYLRSVVFFSDDSIESLISSCTNLEDMVIEKCHMWNISNFNISHHLLRRLTILCSEFVGFDFWLMIDAPNLAYFKYIDHVVARYSLENLQTVVKADIGIFNNSKVKWAHWETRLETLLSSSPELEQLDFDQEFLSSLPDKGNILAHRINGGKPSTG